MSSFSIANTLVLRNFYNGNRNYVVKTSREDVSTDKLSYTDSVALRRAVKKLGSYDFKNAEEDDIEEMVRGFIDTYNYTLDSSKYSTNRSVQSAYKNMKKLAETYADDLADVGIKADSSGYLKLSSSAKTNIKGARFQEKLGSDSTFMKQLSTYAKQISSHIDLYL